MKKLFYIGIASIASAIAMSGNVWEADVAADEYKSGGKPFGEVYFATCSILRNELSNLCTRSTIPAEESNIPDFQREIKLALGTKGITVIFGRLIDGDHRIGDGFSIRTVIPVDYLAALAVQVAYDVELYGRWDLSPRFGFPTPFIIEYSTAGRAVISSSSYLMPPMKAFVRGLEAIMAGINESAVSLTSPAAAAASAFSSSYDEELRAALELSGKVGMAPAFGATGGAGSAAGGQVSAG